MDLGSFIAYIIEVVKRRPLKYNEQLQVQPDPTSGQEEPKQEEWFYYD